jgi:vancomycin resistance protein VanJ
VRCACGIAYHTSDVHIGKQLACRCGRSVLVARPSAAPDDASPTRNQRGRGSALFAADVPEEKPRRRRSSRQAHIFSKHDVDPAAVPHRRASRGVHAARRSWPGRVQRALSVWLASTIRPLLSRRPLTRYSAAAAWLYLLGSLGAWFALHFESEVWLSATVLTYGPRSRALYPLLLIVPLCLYASRAALWPAAVGAWICLVPVMGGRVTFATLFSPALLAVPAAGTFRVLTYNVDGGGRLAIDLATFLREQAPDIVGFQECNDALWNSLAAQQGWYSKRYGSLCTGSRWPISDVETMNRDDLAKIAAYGYGGTGLVMRTVIESPHGTLLFVNLHLETARKGLEAILGHSTDGAVDPQALPSDRVDGSDATTVSNIRRFEINADIRRAESARASRFASQGSNAFPIVVSGDFNLPVESTIFHDNWLGFTDAFEARGNGFGWSRQSGNWIRIRIDHILTNARGPRPLKIVLGPDYSSDHRPVIADLAWPTWQPSRQP